MRCERRTRSLEDFMNELLVKFVVAVLTCRETIEIKCIPAGQTCAVYVSVKKYVLSRETECDQERSLKCTVSFIMIL